MTALSLSSLTKRYGAATVVAALDLEVEQGEFLSLLGPSGCGKTTVLRLIAGLAEPDGGRIRIDGRDVTRLKVHKRNIGLVFQSYALFPHMSVFDNVAFGLRRRGAAKAELPRLVGRALDMVRLAGLGDRFPHQLSGGQQQRVAIARAIAPEPALLLLDEPLSNLDKQLREEMQIELKRLQRELGVTTVFVTHDQGEAMSLSDRICVLESGRLQQTGTAEEIYHHPANPFVAGFFGRSNAFRGRLVAADAAGSTVALDGGGEILAGATELAVGAAVNVTIRQENVAIGGPEMAPAENSLAGTVVERAFAGAVIHYVVKTEAGPEILVEAPSIRTGAAPNIDDTVRIGWERDAVILTPIGEPG